MDSMRAPMIFSITIIGLFVGIAVFAEQQSSSKENEDATANEQLPHVPPKVIHKMLVLGNSITRHGPNDKLGWHGNWGMAATTREKDFVHVLYNYLCKIQPKHKPELIVENLLAKGLPSKAKVFESFASHKADLIIVQIGDNLPESKSTRENLEKPYEQLLATLKKKNSPLIIGVGTWGGGAKRDPLMEEACHNQGVTFVRISHLMSDRANRAVSEGHFKHAGVNWHPGDRGMRAIANTLWKVIKRKLKVVREG